MPRGKLVMERGDRGVSKPSTHHRVADSSLSRAIEAVSFSPTFVHTPLPFLN